MKGPNDSSIEIVVDFVMIFFDACCCIALRHRHSKLKLRLSIKIGRSSQSILPKMVDTAAMATMQNANPPYPIYEKVERGFWFVFVTILSPKLLIEKGWFGQY